MKAVLNIQKFALAGLMMISIHLNAQVEKLKFNIIHKKKPIGELIATKTPQGSKTYYADRTTIQAHLLTEIKVDYAYDVNYNEDTFLNSKVVINVNGHEHTRAFTNNGSQEYQFLKDDNDEKEIRKPIKYSSIRLLFDEPIGISSVFSEEYGEFHVIEKVGDHKYRKTSPAGHVNTYYYKDGMLQKGDVQTGLISFTIEPKM